MFFFFYFIYIQDVETIFDLLSKICVSPQPLHRFPPTGTPVLHASLYMEDLRGREGEEARGGTQLSHRRRGSEKESPEYDGQLFQPQPS